MEAPHPAFRCGRRPAEPCARVFGVATGLLRGRAGRSGRARPEERAAVPVGVCGHATLRRASAARSCCGEGTRSLGHHRLKSGRPTRWRCRIWRARPARCRTRRGERCSRRRPAPPQAARARRELRARCGGPQRHSAEPRRLAARASPTRTASWTPTRTPPAKRGKKVQKENLPLTRVELVTLA
jgi:hypothetical protein